MPEDAPTTGYCRDCHQEVDILDATPINPGVYSLTTSCGHGGLRYVKAELPKDQQEHF